MVLGILLPFLMVIQVLESTFFLNFFSWSASVAGIGFWDDWVCNVFEGEELSFFQSEGNLLHK